MTSSPFGPAVTRPPGGAQGLARLSASRGLAIAAAATLLAIALGFSALRGQIIHLRYQAARLLDEERRLEETRRLQRIRVQELRDPRRLAALGAARGFGRPERVIDLERATGGTQ